MHSNEAMLKESIAAHQAGALAQAEAGYRQVLLERPEDPDALHFLGMLLLQRGAVPQALQLIRQSLEIAPTNPHAWNNLGNLLIIAERPAEAKQAYRRAVELAPTMSEAHYNLAVSLRDEGEAGPAVMELQAAISCSPNFFRAYETLAMLCYRLGDLSGAAETYRVWSHRDPGNAKARHMAAATSGVRVPPRASADYVRMVFDHVARGFDRNLKQLGYRAPEIVATKLAEHAAALATPLDVLDAGCGTGLCGPLIRRHCQRLVGIDLSQNMLAIARERGSYDECVTAELCEFLRSQPASFTAIISADTLVYFGALEEACAAACQALRPDGVFIATFEALLVQHPAGYRLEEHGRYTHRAEYLRAALEGAGLEVVELTQDTLRQERLQDVVGHVAVARRPKQSF
jgi:predicted TPR repeat methyltransferase